MTVNDLKKEIEIALIKAGQITHADLAKMTGRSPQAMSKRLKKKSLNTDDLDLICNAIGYEWVVTIQPKTKAI